MQICLRNRPQIRGVRNPTLPAQVSGDFAEFRQIWRNFPRIAPLHRRTGRLTGPRTAEIPHGPMEIFYTIGQRFVGCEIPPFPPKYVAISLNFGRYGGIPLNRAPSPQNRPMAGPRTAEIFQDSMDIFLHDRPQIHGLRNSALPAQVSVDFAESRQIWRNPPLNRAPTPQNRPDGRSANRRDFSGFREDISTQSATDSRGVELHPFRPSKW